MTTRLKDRKELERIVSNSITPHDFIQSLDQYFKNVCKDAVKNRDALKTANIE